ncbi:MAG TPA: sulfotransferase, partial [Gammaproteobacteria bacterium]|nr:sulfotransferase [Gammaproteobacteria bacterium]
LGMAYMAAGRYADAGALLERALAADADFPEAYGNLAVVYEQSNRYGEAARLVGEGLARWPGHGTLQLIAARLARRDGDDRLARERLLALQTHSNLMPALKRDVEFELGWCADGLGDTDAAMRHFSAAKLQAEALATPSVELKNIYPRQVEGLLKLYGGPVPPMASAAVQPLPSFLLGFPRSGTTLLDTMLDAHGGFTVMEERPSIQAILDTYLAAGLNYPADLPRMTPKIRTHLRAAYFRVCRDASWDGSRPLIDKSPFASTHVGLIQQIFPGAPLVFLARHPCDVVLSCFMNNFEFNSGTVHFTRLDTTVRLYCDAMALWLLYLERLPLHHIMLRYEDLVTRPEEELRRLLEFLQMPWSPSVLDHAAQALRRGRIPTPSYQQVSRPLYQSARDRWRRYAAYIEPHLPALMPYIRAFGYAA